MDKTALITGASRGIGAAIAEAFAGAGYRLALNCRTAASGEASAARCRELGAQAEIFAADVSDFAACGGMVKAVREKFGGIDVLVNNAGITRDGLIARMSEEAFDEVIAVNLKSMFNTIRHVAPIMMKQRSGSIVNISSAVGVYGNASQLNYSAAKAGVIGLTKATAKELGSRNIACNAIAPGFIDTDMTRNLPEAVRQGILEATSLGRFGTAQDVAQAVLFLASGGFITGQVLLVDGGLRM